jgi:hypothetical protein
MGFWGSVFEEKFLKKGQHRIDKTNQESVVFDLRHIPSYPFISKHKTTMHFL